METIPQILHDSAPAEQKDKVIQVDNNYKKETVNVENQVDNIPELHNDNSNIDDNQNLPTVTADNTAGQSEIGNKQLSEINISNDRTKSEIEDDSPVDPSAKDKVMNRMSEELSKSDNGTTSTCEPDASASTSSSETEPSADTSPQTKPSCSKAATQTHNVPVDKSIYHVKWIGFNKSKCAVITQNENGPCPLLSIVNVLLLRGKLALPEGCEVISAGQLLEYLADLLLSSDPDLPREERLDYQHNMNDAIAILPKLQTGLDVNVKFTGVKHFEYTPECIIFDLLNISLYHGWLVDPQMPDIALAVNSMSYNQLVEKIITQKCSTDSSLVTQSLVAQQFLEESASQLTYHGLCELNTTMKDGQLAVFFRNNHFSTLYKQVGELFLLVTDQGFLNQTRVVWETLSNIEGDGEFVDDELNTVAAAPEQEQQEPLSPEQQLEQDQLLAMTLQEEDEAACARDKQWNNFKEKHFKEKLITDEELAAKLQEAENMAAAQAEAEASTRQERPAPSSSAREQGPQNPIGPRHQNKKDKNCVIL